jgi:predicted PurR-regulated permease PerM
VLVAVLVGGELFGISGVLLALPAAAVGRVLLDSYLDRRRLRLGAVGTATGDAFAPDQAQAGEVQDG